MITNQVHAILLNSNNTNCYIPFEVELRWDAADPLSVHLVCKLPEGDVDWIVGRDLLHKGATSLVKVGEGDVGFKREGPASSRLLVRLETGEGRADIALNQPHVVRFLDRTQTVCKLGEEDLSESIDGLIEEIYNA